MLTDRLMRPSRAALVCGLTAVFVGVGTASGSGDRVGSAVALCQAGTVDAVIAGKRVCLRSGKSCSKRLDGQYQSYWFRCRSGRLARVPSAGKIVASIPVPAVGGLAIGAGAVWVANMNPRTVTRIDPETTPSSRRSRSASRISSGAPRGLPSVTALCGRLTGCPAVSFGSTRKRTGLLRPSRWDRPHSSAQGPLGIAVTLDAVWVANTWGTTEAPNGSVVRIDPQTDRIVARLALGASPEDLGPRAVTAGPNAVWVGVLSTTSVVRVDPATSSIVAEVPGLTCAQGQLAVDDSSLRAADCTSVRRIDARGNTIARTVQMPRATGQGVLGIAVGLGSVWVQAGSLVRLDPASGAVTGVLPLPAVWNDCAYSIAFGFDSVWVRQHDRVVRIRP